MFPNTPEVSQMVFSMLYTPVWIINFCPKNHLSVGKVTKVLGGLFFVSSESASYTYGFGGKFEDMK